MGESQEAPHEKGHEVAQGSGETAKRLVVVDLNPDALLATAVTRQGGKMRVCLRKENLKNTFSAQF